MSHCTICTELHVLSNLSPETEKLATNVTFLNPSLKDLSHKGPETPYAEPKPL